MSQTLTNYKKTNPVFERFCSQFHNKYTPYIQSLRSKKGIFYFLAKDANKKCLVIGSKSFKILPLSYKNRVLLQKKFPDLIPVVSRKKVSFGFGDRLGITTPAHIRAVREYDIFPIFAQQSVRELNKTGRTWESVMSDAVYGVFQEGFRKPFGADADHVKSISELKKAHKAGFTFFTMDLSDGIVNTSAMSKKELENLSNIPKNRELASKYLNKTYKFAGKKFKFDLPELQDIIITYAGAVLKMEKVYDVLKKGKQAFELEVSVDETSIPSSCLAHVFIAEELKRRKIKFESLALRFPGKFEKGIDYIGNKKNFAKELKVHSAIAKKYGYKLSLHSGSDKFSIYPVFAKLSGKTFHVKTSGTSWLEAVRAIALKNPALYRSMHKYALKKFLYNCKFYDIGTKLSQIPGIKSLSDPKLTDLLKNRKIRQLIHISYGSLLDLYRDKIYKTLYTFEEEFYEAIKLHLQKHLDKLNI